MRVNGIGPSIVTAVKIQQLTRSRPAVAQPTAAPIRDVLDLSSSVRASAPRAKQSVGQVRAFYRSAIRVARSLFFR
ncbi:MAG: hypothetical protein CMJ64_24520 [Planctomycetaceae bacterium]|nr:hypothetical protein [Planctomycetaceae bacterium]